MTNRWHAQNADPVCAAGFRNPLPPVRGLSGIERGLSLSFVLFYLEC